MLADISRGSAWPTGLWAKGFVEEMVKGSRKLMAGPQSMLGMAQAVLMSGQRQEKRDSREGQGWDELSANTHQQWDKEQGAGTAGGWELPHLLPSARWVSLQLTLGTFLVVW